MCHVWDLRGKDLGDGAIVLLWHCVIVALVQLLRPLCYCGASTASCLARMLLALFGITFGPVVSVVPGRTLAA